MGTPACPNYADRVIPYEVTEATAFSAFLPTTWAPGPHNSPVRIVPLSAPPGSGPGPAPAPGRWPHRAHAQDRVGRRHAPARVRAAHAAREAGRAHPTAADQPRALPLRARAACRLAGARGRLPRTAG